MFLTLQSENYVMRRLSDHDEVSPGRNISILAHRRCKKKKIVTVTYMEIE